MGEVEGVFDRLFQGVCVCVCVCVGVCVDAGLSRRVCVLRRKRGHRGDIVPGGSPTGRQRWL